ncbi:MAG: peptidoglycan-binding protein [Treponema sp.]|nr:peptidoglycan-binding protein [Treponema sp.]MCL2250965.1 peptidoglycan-binding protein [Treponema sp.]
MDCLKIKELIYECDDDSMPLLNQIQVWWHTLTCSNCAQHSKLFEVTKKIMSEDFFPASPDFEDSIMAKIVAEIEEEELENAHAIPGGISTKRWVVTGIIIMISLVTAFFSLDYQNLASEWGMSFLLPMGITIGIILTIYGAVFIGSHLKELSERFGL